MRVERLEAPHGPVMVSSDLHGNLPDFMRLRQMFLASAPNTIWVSVGDLVHGPDDEGRARLPLFDYPDETPALLAEWFALQDAHPGRVLSLLGNHEHAHVGGMKTSKFHHDEAAFLEHNLGPARTAELRARLQSWPDVALFPRIGLVVTHGALRSLDGEGRWAYGYGDGDSEQFLAGLGGEYRLVVHGHDREEDGFSSSGGAGLLLCTSFGARHETKTVLRLLPDFRGTVADLRVGHELVRLHA
jgi:hypothetical protein